MDALRNEPLLPRSASFDTRPALSRRAVGAVGAALAWLRRTICSRDASTVKAAGLLGACGVLGVGVLGVLNPLSLLTPLHFLTSAILGAFGLFALALELEGPFLEAFHRWVGFWLRALMRPNGRGLFYAFLGTLCTGLGDPLSVAAGLFEVAAGVACMCGASGGRGGGSPDDASEASSELSPGSASDAELARGAFRRRLLFGKRRLVTAELANLCAELGLQLDLRARTDAARTLDPDAEGYVDEEAFLAWWEQHRSLRGSL